MYPTTASKQLQEALEKHLHDLSDTYCWEKAQQEACNCFQKLELPSTKSEDYRYTPITAILSEKFDLRKSPPIKASSDPTVIGSYIQPLLQQPLSTYPVVLINGAISNTYSPISLNQPSFQVHSFIDAYQQHKDLFVNYFDKYVSNQLDVFFILNTALFRNGILIYIPDNTILDKPLCIYNLTDSTTQQGINYPRVLVALGKNSRISLINSWHTLGSHIGFTNAVTDIMVGQHSQLDYYTLQIQLGKAYQVNTTHFYQAKHSVVNNYTLTWDGLLVRNNLYLHMQEPHTKANMYGIYCLNSDQHVDNHTTVNHQQPYTESNELYKGILTGHATGVFNGKIYVQSEAQKTNAFQRNNNIILSDGATMHTKPQLEIWADDVKCSHGATVGQLETAQLFYLRTRGISEKLARRMLLYVFADEVISKVPILSLRHYLQEKFTVHLDQLV